MASGTTTDDSLRDALALLLAIENGDESLMDMIASFDTDESRRVIFALAVLTAAAVHATSESVTDYGARLRALLDRPSQPENT